MNICMIGHGMMGRWHSETLAVADCTMHTVIGRRAEPTAAFAKEMGYRNWTTDLAVLSDPEIDAVIVASPSEQHYAMAKAALESGKHTLVEIPIAMHAPEAEEICELAERRRLRLGAVHPLRLIPHIVELKRRLVAGEETLRLFTSAFIIKRWENVGGTGYRRSWTDNLLWHHLAHYVDLALWLAAAPPAEVSGFLPAPDSRTGTPMHAVVGARTKADQSLSFVGSYAGHDPVREFLALTDRDCYRFDGSRDLLKTVAGEVPLRHEKEDCADVLRDFLASIREQREPTITGRSVLPAMRLLQAAQDDADAIHGTAPIVGR